MIELLQKYWLQFLMTLISGGLMGALSYLYKTGKATKKGMRALLRSDILRTYHKYEEKGYMPEYARDSIYSEYEPYKELGGNGTIKDIVEKFVPNMPTSPPERDIE